MSIYLIGDSHVGGLRAPLQAALGQPISVDFTNGTKTSDWLSRGAHVADLVIIVLGTNDIYAGVQPEQSGINADALEQLQGSPVLWVGPPNYARDHGTTDAIAQYVSRFADSRSLSLQMQSDGVHPTAAGYAQWAQWIASQVINAPAQSVQAVQLPVWTGIESTVPTQGSNTGIMIALGVGALLLLLVLK